MEDIKKLSHDVLLRIVCFVLFYVALIGCGVALFYATLYLTPVLYSWGKYLAEEVSPRAAGFAMFLIPILWLLIPLMAIYMVKPIFKFTRNKKAGRIEVRERDCPKLFETVREIASSTGCPMPKHLYLSADVNACVFYNTSFWSIFFPVRKNLEIGLGLFHKMSTDEVKSIIAHEFGHFSQKSMKVGSVVYVANTVIYNLVNGQDAIDRWMYNLKHSRFNLIGLVGGLFNSITGWIGSLVAMVYRFIQVKYLQLSRTMEFDADRVACEYIGSDVFISALSKLEHLSEGEAFYYERLRALVDDKKRIADYLATYEASTDLLFEMNKIELSFDSPTLYAPVPDYTRVSIGDVWQTHPSTPDRIIHARQQQGTPPRHTPVNAWALIPPTIREKVSDAAAHAFYEKQWDELSEVSAAAYREWLPAHAKAAYVPIAFQPYFDRALVPFDTDAVAVQPVPLPVTDDHTTTLKHYIGALSDRQTLYGIANKEIIAPTYYYNGVAFKRKQTPEKEHAEYLEGLRTEAQAIDILMYQYLMSNCSRPDELRARYNHLFYAMRIFDDGLNVLAEQRDFIIYQFQENDEFTDKQFNKLMGVALAFEELLLKTVRSLDYDTMHLVSTPEVTAAFKAWAAEPHPGTVGKIAKGRYKGQPEIKSDALNSAFDILHTLSGIHSDLIYQSNRHIYQAFCSVYYSEEVATEEAVA
ncbi:MAG: M48 family metalloprotease [Prevotellaceae bacterium]|jgi:Zn-dependent protease with chaperone function|nr:M48 family metalloprotease [Prevotellaceae bacterium]